MDALIHDVDVIAIQRFFLAFQTGIERGQYQFTPAKPHLSGLQHQTGRITTLNLRLMSPHVAE